MSIQLAIKLADQTVADLDRLVSSGEFATRTDAVRAAVERMLADIRERQVTAAIIEGYRRVPGADSEDAWADAATRSMILEEPWT
jgi:Arc/MetJ-type ribon-helix-helix transcriptional regulator